MSNSTSHFVLIPMAAWGHLRPLLHLAINLLLVHPELRITFLLAPSTIPTVSKEIASPAFAHIHAKSDPVGVEHGNGRAISDRLHLITVKSEEFELPESFSPDTMVKEAIDFGQTIPSFLRPLLEGKEDIIKEKVCNKFKSLPASCIVFDTFQSFIPEVTTRLLASIGRPLIPILGFLPCNVPATWNHFAPASQGGVLARLKEKVEEQVKNGGDAMQAYAKYGFLGEGQVVDVPGLGKMYDYERYPCIGAVTLPPQVYQQIATMTDGVNHPSTTALILPTDSTLDKEVNLEVSRMLGKELIQVGIQFPPQFWDKEPIDLASDKEDDKRVMAFLDKMQEKYGDHSVIYVSFGSAWWPATRPELVTWLLESLTDSGFPFIFAHASFMENLPLSTLEKINANEDSIEVKFAPQWAVLDHPATGYFLSHCGSNSTAEAIMTETPIAAWPFAADQGEFTHELVKSGLAIEIKQVKTFNPPTFKTLYDGTEIVGTEEAVKAELESIWGRLRGQEGLEMRDKMRSMREVLKASWEHGAANEAMKGLSRFF